MKFTLLDILLGLAIAVFFLLALGGGILAALAIVIGLVYLWLRWQERNMTPYDREVQRRFIRRYMLLATLFLCGSLHGATWSRAFSAGPLPRYMATLPCGQAYVTRAAQAKHGWYWHVGLKHGWAPTLIMAEAAAKAVCK